MMLKRIFTAIHIFVVLRSIVITNAFTTRPQKQANRIHITSLLSSSPQQQVNNDNGQKNIMFHNLKPRRGIAQMLLNWALTSPLWKLILVPQARKNIVKTAEANGIKWTDSYQWLLKQLQQQEDENDVFLLTKLSNNNSNDALYPEFYTKEFHAYEKGNLCWDAAIEQELASRAVGARNFPEYGSNGEDAFREKFENALLSLGASVPTNGVILDMGCGTGISTRRLASLFPHAKKITGMDLSPYFISVGRLLLKLLPKGQDEGGPWVTTIKKDERIDLCVGNALNTKLANESIDAVNLSLVIHELPLSATCDIINESLRILKANGQLFISEMDFDSPAYAEQRANALLFSLLRSTEPYLDEYADGFPEMLNYLVDNFQTVKITAATGRHYALVATKGGVSGESKSSILEDRRFDDNGNYMVDDTHLKVWESKGGK